MKNYKLEHSFGVEDGDTQLRRATKMQKVLARNQWIVPCIWVVLAAAIVVGGQQYFEFSVGKERGNNQTCTFFQADWENEFD